MKTSIYIFKGAASPEPPARGSDRAAAGGESRPLSVGVKRSIDTISTHIPHSQEDTEDDRYGNSWYGDSFTNKILQALWHPSALLTQAEQLLQEAQNYLERVRETHSPEVQQLEDFKSWRKTLECNMAKLRQKIDGNSKSDEDFQDDYPPFRPQLIKIFEEVGINADVSVTFQSVFDIKPDAMMSCRRFARMNRMKVLDFLEQNFNACEQINLLNAYHKAGIQWDNYLKKVKQAPKLDEIFKQVEISLQLSEQFKEVFKIDPDDFLACRQFAELSFLQVKRRCEENEISDYMTILDAHAKAFIQWGCFSGESFP
jgi:hypothetical protein